MDVRVQKSPIHGNGVFANTLVPKGWWQYVYGDVRVLIPNDPFERYGYEWDSCQTFIPYAPWCFVNHSCRPNCYVTETENRLRPMLFIEAIRDIEPNEELLVDYGFDPS